MHPSPASAPGLLGDTAGRDYAAKLRSFNAFAAPELRRLIAGLGLKPGMRILDAGCGTGEALPWLLEATASTGSVTGIDLSSAHVAEARRFACDRISVLQGDLLDIGFPAGSFDFIWCVNTLNHLRDPREAVRKLRTLLCPDGRLGVGQSAFLPDMYFAWDARLERVTNEAVRQHYRERYALDERDLTAVRANVGLLRECGLRAVTAQTLVIERIQPLAAPDEHYLLDTMFRGTFGGERLRPYLSAVDHRDLMTLCDPDSGAFALHRPDFHFLQTFTLVTGGR